MNPKLAPRDVEGVRTQLGGLFYLVNLMLHLNLPTCFEEKWGLASQVGAWGVLEILSRALFGTDHGYLASDAIWKVLAELDGRLPGQLPGRGFCGQDSFRLPKAWRSPVDNDKHRFWYWASARKRLRLWSEHGYVLADIPKNPSVPRKQATEELGTFLQHDNRPRLFRRPSTLAPVQETFGPLLEGLNQNLKYWLSMTVPYIRFRLSLALNSYSKDTQTLAQTLLFYPGRLFVTSTHVDLVMSLESISLPVRMAGLDRNPGWLPDFSRVVQFHFR
jgi:hypothetical protein